MRTDEDRLRAVSTDKAENTERNETVAAGGVREHESNIQWMR